MKKAFVTLCIIMMTAVTAFAGGGDKTTRYYAPKNTQGWFIDLAGTYSIMASNGCAFHDITTYYGGLNADPAIQQHQFGFSAKLGRRVSKSVAFRFGYDRHLASNMIANDFMFKSFHFDAMESPIDFFFGYNPDRFYTMWIYGGVGILAMDRTTDMRPYNILIHWDDDIEFGIHGGIMNNFRLSNSLDLHIDLTAIATRWSLDVNTPDNVGDVHWHRAHFDFSGMVGLMWYLGGRRFDAVPECPVCPECPEVTGDCSRQEANIDELNARIAQLQADLDECLKNGGTIKEVIADIYPFSIFFNLGSYELRDQRDIENLKVIAQVAKDHNLMVNLKGTCDEATGSVELNRTLSQNRCNKIESELVKLGVPAGNIVKDPQGGVTDLGGDLDRRVFISFSVKE